MGGDEFFASQIYSAFKLDALPGTNRDQNKGEQGEKRISDFQVTSEDRPILGSFYLCLIGITVSFLVQIAGWGRIYRARKLSGFIYLSLGLCIAFSCTVGLLFNLDPLSLWRLL
jgi:hypothetical protein